jgi:hypothetical protein
MRIKILYFPPFSEKHINTKRIKLGHAMNVGHAFAVVAENGYKSIHHAVVVCASGQLVPVLVFLFVVP